MTLAPARPALAPSPPPPAAGTTPSTALVPAAAPCPTRSPRPHYLAAAAAAGVELVDLAVWLLLRPLGTTAAYLLLIIATAAGSVITGAAAFISSGKPLPERKAGR